MSRSSEFHESKVLGYSGSPHTDAASERLLLEFSSLPVSRQDSHQSYSSIANNEAPLILMPAPVPEPPVHTGVKDGSPFIVIETPYEFK